jgi:predicted RNA-binding Zn ribbon-like protein
MTERAAPRARSLSPEKPFVFVAGDASLDFVNTVDWTTHGFEFERLTSYERFVEWALAAEIVSRTAAQQLGRAARSSARRAQAAYRRVMWTRWVLQRLFFAITSRSPNPQALADFNDLLGDALAHMRLERPRGSRGLRDSLPLVRSWHHTARELESPLWPVVWHAGALLISDEIVRVRVCAAEDCGWMYVDRSRNGLRRWCQMETCGTRVKNQRRAGRLMFNAGARASRPGA